MKGVDLSINSPPKKRPRDDQNEGEAASKRLCALVECLEQDQRAALHPEQQVLEKNAARINDVAFSGALGAALHNNNEVVVYSLDAPLPLVLRMPVQTKKALEAVGWSEELNAQKKSDQSRDQVAEAVLGVLAAVQLAADSLLAFTSGGACVEQAAASLLENMARAKTVAEATAALTASRKNVAPRVAVTGEGFIHTTATGVVIVTPGSVVQFATPVTCEQPDDVTLIGSTVYILSAGVVRSFNGVQMSGRNVLKSAQVPSATAVCSFKNRLFVLVDATKTVVELDHLTLEEVRTFDVSNDADCLLDVTANTTCLIVAASSSISFYSLLTGALLLRTAAAGVKRVAAHDSCMLVLTATELLRWKFMK